MLLIRSGSPYWLLASALLGLAVGVGNGALLLAIHLYAVAAVGLATLGLFVWVVLVAWQRDRENV